MLMETLEDLQQLWQQQPAGPALDAEALRERAVRQMEGHRRRVLVTNVGITLGFALAIGVGVGVYLRFPDRSGYFYGSLICMGVLLLVMLAVLWMGVGPKPASPVENPQRYLKQARRPLKMRLATYRVCMPAYMGLLWGCFQFYFRDLYGAWTSSAFLTASGALTAWVLGVYFFSRRKQRRQRAELQQMLDDLDRWEERLGE